MKKAAKIILIIAGVFGIISFVAAVIFAVIFFIAPSVPELQQVIADGLQYAMDEGMEEQYLEMLQWAADNLGIFTGIMGGSLLGSSFMTLLSVIFCFVGAGADKKGLYVVDIILGFFCSSLLQLVGGILGLIGAGKKKEEQPKPAEAAPKEEPVIVAPPVEEGVAISDDEAELVTTEDLSPVTKKEQKQIEKAEAATYEEQEPEIQKEVKEEIKNEPVKKAAPKKAAPKKAPAAKKE